MKKLLFIALAAAVLIGSQSCKEVKEDFDFTAHVKIMNSSSFDFDKVYFYEQADERGAIGSPIFEWSNLDSNSTSIEKNQDPIKNDCYIKIDIDNYTLGNYWDNPNGMFDPVSLNSEEVLPGGYYTLSISEIDTANATFKVSIESYEDY